MTSATYHDDHSWHDTLVRRLGIGVVAGAWALETAMNAAFGWSKGIGWALGFICIAIFGSVLGVMFRQIEGAGTMAQVKRCLLALPFLFCFAMSQVAGWSVAAVQLADGSVSRGVKAASGATAREDLDRLRAQQKAVGVAVDPAQIEAQIAAQMAIYIKQASKTVGEATRQCAEPSWAPVACRKVADLKAELARAQTASGLPDKIAAAAKRAAAAPMLAEADPYLDNLIRVTGAEKDDVKFWFVAAFVGLLGFIANVGPALLVGPNRQPSGQPAGAGGREPAGPRGPRYLPAPPAEHWGFFDGPNRQPYGQPAGSGGGASVAPNINISVGGSPHGAGAAAVPAAGEVVSAPALPPLLHYQAARAIASDAIQLAPVISERPADQSNVKRMLDQLAVFRADQLVDAPGAIVSADWVWQRYVVWAGPRAMGRPMFDALLPDVTGIARTGLAGDVHYHDVQLRPAAQVAL